MIFSIVIARYNEELKWTETIFKCNYLQQGKSING